MPRPTLNLRPAPTLVVFAALLLAGCAGPSNSASLTTTTSAPADDTGTVTGVVVDEELQPVEGAIVGLVSDTKIRTTTDRIGNFALHGLPPGPHKLLVQKDGYRPETVSVDVILGEPTATKIPIKAIPVVPTRQVTMIYSGYLGVDVALPPGNQFAQGTQGANRRSVYYDIEQPNLISVVSGIKWQSGAPLLSERMYLLVYLNFPPNLCDDAARPYCLPMATAEGKSPLVAGSNDYAQHLLERQDLKINMRFKMRGCVQGDVGPSWTNLSRCTSPTEAVQVAVEQRVDGYTTLFYGSTAPADYSPVPS